jgi:peroxiredoxin (alkyl hydroperoxide reductase subunit C)
MKQTVEKIPNFEFTEMVDGEWKKISTDSIFKGRRVAVFSLPGAFTPTCTTSHLPRYDELYPELIKAGLDDVYCLSVNDTFVMKSWFKDLGIKNVNYLSDGTGKFTEGLGMLVNKDDLGFGMRSWRYSMIINDGKIEKMFIEPDKPGDPFEVSDADTLLNYVNPEAEKPQSHVLITRSGCPFCSQAKAFLDERNINYHSITKDDHGVNAVVLRGITGNSTYPQLIIEGNVIGGLDNIVEYFK